MFHRALPTAAALFARVTQPLGLARCNVLRNGTNGPVVRRSLA